MGKLVGFWNVLSYSDLLSDYQHIFYRTAEWHTNICASSLTQYCTFCLSAKSWHIAFGRFDHRVRHTIFLLHHLYIWSFKSQTWFGNYRIDVFWSVRYNICFNSHTKFQGGLLKEIDQSEPFGGSITLEPQNNNSIFWKGIKRESSDKNFVCHMKDFQMDWEHLICCDSYRNALPEHLRC